MAFTTLAFPGAHGWGKNALGGSGRHLPTPTGTVYRVTNLNNSGSGSLRDALQASGVRTVIFEISGTIVLSSDIQIKNPYLTVAGETAPSPGITIRGGVLNVRTSHVIISHLRLRPGALATTTNAIRVKTFSGEVARDVMVSHCSMSWASDQLFSAGASGNTNGIVDRVTFQDCLGGEPLDISGGHPFGPLFGGGTNAVTGKISLIRTLLAQCKERNPRIGTSATVVEMVNNVAYDWGGVQTINCKNTGGDGQPSDLTMLIDLIGGYMKAGPNSSTSAYNILSGGSINSSSRLYVDGNIGPLRLTDTGDEWLVVKSDIPESPHKSLTRVADSGDGHTPMSPTDAYNYVLLNAGARPNNRDSVDTRIINSVVNGTNNWQGASPAGGWPNLAVNTVSHSIPSNPFAEGTDGYTRLENWLHTFSAALAGSEPPPPVPPPVIPPVTPPDVTPDVGDTRIAVVPAALTSRYKAQQFVTANGTKLAAVYIDSRSQEVTSSEVAAKLED